MNQIWLPSLHTQ